MQQSLARRAARRFTYILAALATNVSYASASESTPVFPGPLFLRGPDPAFTPDRQCRGRYAADDLARYLPRARLAMSLPGTQSVTLDNVRRCIVVNVHTVGSGRLAELVMRGVTVPRKAIFLNLVHERRS
jgi:hypothetical protein